MLISLWAMLLDADIIVGHAAGCLNHCGPCCWKLISLWAMLLDADTTVGHAAGNKGLYK